MEQEDIVRLDLGVLKRLIGQRFEDETSALIKAWPVIPAPGRTTIWRWLKGMKFPRNVDELFGLAGALNADPLALLSLSEETTWNELCDATREYHWNFKLAPQIARFWFLQNLIGPGMDWPSSPMAQKYFKRTWQRLEHSYRATRKRNYYAPFLLQPDEGAPDQVWHFAWRSRSDKPWRPYGFIRREQSTVHLCSFEGLEAIANVTDHRAFVVETWFGSGDADFCVASLHPVKCTVESTIDKGTPGVRFGRSPFQS